MVTGGAEFGARIGVKISEKWDSIKKNTSEKWEEIKNSAAEKMEGFQGRIGDKLLEIKDGFKNTFGSLAKEALNWGGDIIGNIVGGIKDKAENVKDAISEIGSTIREYLHFSEPDRGPLADFNDWMPDMMSQMADQIEAGRAKVQAAVSNVAYDLSMPRGNVNTLYYGGTTIELHAGNNVDIRALAEQIQGLIDDDFNSKKGVFA